MSNSIPVLSVGELSSLDKILEQDQINLNRLRNIKPMILDVSIREPSVGINKGHTVNNKVDILKLVDELNFDHTVLATFNYGLPDEPQPDDEFCHTLKQQGYDFNYGFAFCGLGEIKASIFSPTIDMLKVVDFGFSNVILDFDLIDVLDDSSAFLQILTESIVWLKENLTKSNDRDGNDRISRIYINFRDIPDVYASHQGAEAIMQVCKLCQDYPIDAILIEDPRGTFFPFQIASIVKIIRAVVDPELAVLVHIHSGNGMENACVMEAILAGADGTWAGFTKEAATIGHASNMEFISNLARCGNESVKQKYPLHSFSSISNIMRDINCFDSHSDELPIFGSKAYASMLSVFDQKPQVFMDLAPELVGQHYSYRICPIGSDEAVIRGRLKECGLAAEINDETLKNMRRLMRRDLISGERIDYNRKDNLQELLDRASLLATGT